MSELPLSPPQGIRTAVRAPSILRRRPVVAVVGGGISGLAVAHFLHQASVPCVLFEAADRCGGVIRTEHIAGRVLECGPQRTRLTPAFDQLVRSLDLTDRLITAPDLPLYIYSRDRLRAVPLDIATALTTDLLSWVDRLRLLAEPFTGGLRADESAAEFFIRKVGRSTYRRAIAPLFGDLYGSDPADMSARHALASMLRAFRIEGSLLRAFVRGMRTRDRSPACSFREGLQTLPNAMAASLAAAGCLRTAAPVANIQRDARRFRIDSGAGELTADHVVLACPARAASAILGGLDADASRTLGRLRYNDFVVVHLESDVQFFASGFQVAPDAGLATRGVTCNQSLFGRAGIYTSFLGGAGSRAVTESSDEDLAGLAAKEFREILDADAMPLSVHRTTMPAWDRSWDATDALRLPDGVSVCSNWAGRPGIGGRLAEAAAVAARLVPA